MYKIKVDLLKQFIRDSSVVLKLDFDAETFKHLNTERVYKIIYKVAKYGWYFDDFSKDSNLDTSKCIKFINSNLPQKLDSYMSDYYKNRIIQIKKKLIIEYPKRKEIISEAFYTQGLGLYSSSICLFITLIDGICDDVLNLKFFKNEKFLPEIKTKIEDKNRKNSDFLLSPIHKKGVINAWEKDLENFPIRFNRHEIIHGIDVNYGSEINSLKIISMLSYVDYILSHYEKQENYYKY
jgi:hypothetical protein